MIQLITHCTAGPKNSVGCNLQVVLPLPSLPLTLLFPSALLPLPLEVGPLIAARGLGERFSSPAGPGGARPPNAFWCNPRPKFCTLVELCRSRFRMRFTTCSVTEDKLCPPSLSKSSFACSNSSVGTQKGFLGPAALSSIARISR